MASALDWFFGLSIRKSGGNALLLGVKAGIAHAWWQVKLCDPCKTCAISAGVLILGLGLMPNFLALALRLTGLVQFVALIALALA